MTAQVYDRPVCRLAGDKGFLVEFGDAIDPRVNAQVGAMARAMEKNLPPGILEVIPTYRSLLFIYDPDCMDPDRLYKLVENLDDGRAALYAEVFKVVEIPVCYGKEFGPDIGNVQKASGLTQEQV
ncbi:MAG: carboxyltransferase domain-containing protein, partial [Desulfotignum sp.]|nr:carboxyltransferase domain-containing protein [Desulfotignum sp.]